MNAGLCLVKLYEANKKKLSTCICYRNCIIFWKIWLTFNFLPVVISDNEDLLTSFKIICNNSISNVNFSNSVKKTGLNFTERIFNIYSNKSCNAVTYHGLVRLMQSLNIGYYGNTDINASDLSLQYDLDYVFDYGDNKGLCLQSADDLLNELYSGISANDVRINLFDFLLILPRLVYDLQSSPCKSAVADDYADDYDNDDRDHDNHGHNHEGHSHDHHTEKNSKNSLKTWFIALASVAAISLLSLVGIMIVPLMRHTDAFKWLLAFLVALAVGTLIGDALLHLLPHALSGPVHAHGEEEHDKILKSLVAVLAVQVFFNFESVMSMWRARRRRKKNKSVPSDPSPTRSDDSLMLDKLPPVENNHLHPSGQFCKNGDVGYEGLLVKNGQISPFLKRGVDDVVEGEANSTVIMDSHDTVPTDDPLLHHHHHHDIANAPGVKDLAWMVIAGDGLHNFSDGLAIGAAFTSSISAGLSTSLAVFCHELPHEFGDFAILVDAGLSIKKALAYNGLSACIAFVGAVVGLLIGEYSTSVKLWILAITAGGFLYVGLVDMLPQMLQQCLEKNGKIIFVFENIGLALGIVVMLLIAWFEESFLKLFNVSHGH